LIQTLLREWAYCFPYRTSGHRIRWLRPWLHFYNHHRQHQSLGGLSPISRLPLMNNVLRMHT
jgi:transposase InsO family protein